ncbi:hypothetical protein N7492_009836 [Penicillium capsulatum]|uniref:Uncharacterized protein n=1 Tax=Penicillium capsulatum TaxID=69766 RepID=A0A9W9HLA9_9EURO|nr:hypothetical protein N7492_009836 [Penicillium capsulatum]KAJ6112347.1 hypothetical protein N7512_007671 [Penicillium capsulatum]
MIQTYEIEVVTNTKQEVLYEVTPNNIHRFFNYYIKLKYSEGSRYLKGTSKARFRGYYRRITQTRITSEDSEEINTISPPIFLAEIKSEHTKKFLGISNNFPFPKIINNPSLIFSPYIFIFGILFWL